jgi:hypothetical protein
MPSTTSEQAARVGRLARVPDAGLGVTQSSPGARPGASRRRESPRLLHELHRDVERRAAGPGRVELGVRDDARDARADGVAEAGGRGRSVASPITMRPRALSSMTSGPPAARDRRSATSWIPSTSATRPARRGDTRHCDSRGRRCGPARHPRDERAGLVAPDRHLRGMLEDPLLDHAPPAHQPDAQHPRPRLRRQGPHDLGHTAGLRRRGRGGNGRRRGVRHGAGSLGSKVQTTPGAEGSGDRQRAERAIPFLTGAGAS